MPKKKQTTKKQTTDIATKPKRASSLRQPYQQPDLEPGDNTAFLSHSLKMWDWETPDMHDNAAVSQRIADYFTICAEDDMKPSVAGLALAFSIDRTTLHRWVNGIQGDVSDSCRHTIKRAYQILNSQMESWMQNGKINPVAGIFLMKNNMGYADKSEVVLSPNANSPQLSDSDLQKKYIESAGIEVIDSAD